MPRVWPHTQLSSSGLVHDMWSNCTSSLAWRMAREWLDVRNRVELSLLSTVCWSHSNTLFVNRLTGETVAWWLLQNENTKSKRFIRAHRNVDTNAFITCAFCGCARWHVYKTKESIKCRYVRQATCFKYGILLFTNRITQASESLFMFWTRWMSDNNYKDSFLDSLKCNTAHAKMVEETRQPTATDRTVLCMKGK